MQKISEVQEKFALKQFNPHFKAGCIDVNFLAELRSAIEPQVLLLIDLKRDEFCKFFRLLNWQLDRSLRWKVFLDKIFFVKPL